MPYVCANCGYSQEDYIEECPDCGGYVEEKEPEVDWMGEGEEGEVEGKKKEGKEEKGEEKKEKGEEKIM